MRKRGFRILIMCPICLIKAQSCLQRLEPSADVSDATVGVDAGFPSSFVLAVPASLVWMLFLHVRATRRCSRVRRLTRVCTRATHY